MPASKSQLTLRALMRDAEATSTYRKKATKKRAPPPSSAEGSADALTAAPCDEPALEKSAPPLDGTDAEQQQQQQQQLSSAPNTD